MWYSVGFEQVWNGKKEKKWAQLLWMAWTLMGVKSVGVIDDGILVTVATVRESLCKCVSMSLYGFYLSISAKELCY